MIDDVTALVDQINGHRNVEGKGKTRLFMLGDKKPVDVNSAEVVSTSFLRVELANGHGHLVIPAARIETLGLYLDVTAES